MVLQFASAVSSDGKVERRFWARFLFLRLEKGDELALQSSSYSRMRPDCFTEPWEAATLHQPPSLKQIYSSQRLDSRGQLLLCIYYVIVMFQLTQPDPRFRSGNYFVKAIKPANQDSFWVRFWME